MDIRRQSRYRRADSKGLARLTISVIVFLGIIFLFWSNLKEYADSSDENKSGNKDFLPAPHLGMIYHKPNFSLSYVEEYEIPEWVAYRLTVGMMNSQKFPRNQDFNPDPSITTGSSHYHDFKQSGYRRGHLVPSADMAWNKESMDATFLLSNISPMREEFNDGIWLELEHNVRDWSRKYKNVFVIAGPIFTNPITSIGENEVLVPRYYYKAVFTSDENKPRVIAFLFDQTQDNNLRLDKYIVPVDSIENETGLDLFANMYGDWDEEIRIEKQNAPSENEWNFNEKWYIERIENK